MSSHLTQEEGPGLVTLEEGAGSLLLEDSPGTPDQGAELTTIREGLAAALVNQFGDSMQISPWMLSNPTPPTAHIFPDEIEYHKAMQNGAENWNLVVQVFVATVSDIGAQKRLDRMIASRGPWSVKAALEAAAGRLAEDDAPLKNVVSGVKVVRTSGYSVYQRLTGEALLGADWQVFVLV